jgi:hypothetical protein
MKIFFKLLILILLISCGQKNKTKKRTEIMTESNYPEKFESDKLTESEKQILSDFRQKRLTFDNYIKESNLSLFTCPGCAYPTLAERGGYDICEVCNWEDDNQDDPKANEVWGGPNSSLSLTENRINIGRILIHLADSLNGKINQNPKQVLEIFKKHRIRMNGIDENKLMNADISDPIWIEYENKGKEVLTDLVTE